jgi:hypothetical protein
MAELMPFLDKIGREDKYNAAVDIIRGIFDVRSLHFGYQPVNILNIKGAQHIGHCF